MTATIQKNPVSSYIFYLIHDEVTERVNFLIKVTQSESLSKCNYSTNAAEMKRMNENRLFSDEMTAVSRNLVGACKIVWWGA